jgi:hypothetical protein
LVACTSPEECAAKDTTFHTPSATRAGATTAQPTAHEEDTMTKKTKKTPNEAPLVTPAMVATAFGAFADMVAEQRATYRAQRFAAYADAMTKLRALGAFPAVEALYNCASAELTVLSRELHNERIAPRPVVTPEAK